MKKLINCLLIICLLTFSITMLAQNYSSMHKHEYDYYRTKQQSPDYYEAINKANLVLRSKSTKNCSLNKIVFGWHPYWMNGLEANYDWSLLSDLSYFGYNVNPNTGNANSTYNWATAAVVDSALANGVRVNLCVTLFSDHATFFGNSTAQQTLITNLINLIQQRNAHGVNIDFEEVHSTQKVALKNFVINLSTQMKTAIPNAQISIALPAVDWSGTFDVVAMLPHIDYFFIMGYDYYYSGSSQAGPTDPLYTHVGTYDRNLSRSITYYLGQGIPSGKLGLGLPYYGREWETTSNTVPSNNTGNFNTSRTYKVIKDNVNGYYSNPVYYHKSESTYHIYQIGGKWRQCFINDAYTLGKRYDMVNQRQLAGIGIWALGYDDGYSDLWDLIENKFTNCATVPCQGTIYDLGGPEGNYYPNENLTYKIAPTGATSLSLTFNSFNLGIGDTLKLFNGSDINAPLIGNYIGNNSPGTINSTGNAITLSFKSSAGATASGWEAVWQCSSDIIPPQTVINVSNSWKTTDFVASFNDTDNQGGSGIDRRFYQIAYLDGANWKANTNRGFLTDDFKVLDNSLWQSPNNSGTWEIVGNTLEQSNVSLANTNIYAPLNQTLSNRYLYHFKAKIEGADANKRFGFHFFADSAQYENRKNSYFVWFRQASSVLEFYKVTNDVFSLKKTINNVTTNTNQWYDIKIIYDRITGDIIVYRDDVLIGDYKDDNPYSSNGNFISFRTGNCKLYVDSINVYRTRLASVNILVGNENDKDIKTQNPNYNTAAGLIKSVVTDIAQNISQIAFATVNIDWTPPQTIAWVNDGLGADIDTIYSTSTLSANWAASNDPNSNIHSYWYAIGTSPGDSNVVAWTNNGTALSVTHSSLSLPYNYTYYFSVKAKNNAELFGIPVSSDGVVVLNPTPENPEICLVTVESGKNKIVWEKQISSNIDSFYIYKETNIANLFVKIGARAYSDSSFFIDIYSNPEEKSDKYAITYVNINGVETSKSIPHKTVHLSINQGIGTTWNLIWEQYQGVIVQTYNIYRGNSNTNLSQIASVSGAETQYSDINAPQGILFYQIEVILPHSCNPSKTISSSRSNIASNDLVNVSSQEIKNNVHIYPNPSKNVLNIQYNDNLVIEIFNCTGQIVHKEVLILNGGVKEKTIDITHLTSGLYFIKVLNNTTNFIEKFIKE